MSDKKQVLVALAGVVILAALVMLYMVKVNQLNNKVSELNRQLTLAEEQLEIRAEEVQDARDNTITANTMGYLNAMYHVCVHIMDNDRPTCEGFLDRSIQYESWNWPVDEEFTEYFSRKAGGAPAGPRNSRPNIQRPKPDGGSSA